MITFTTTFKALGVFFFATLVLLGYSKNVYEDTEITRTILELKPIVREKRVSDRTSIPIPPKLPEDLPQLPTTPEAKKKIIPSSAPREIKRLVV